jgi:hypothetical protein
LPPSYHFFEAPPADGEHLESGHHVHVDVAAAFSEVGGRQPDQLDGVDRLGHEQRLQQALPRRADEERTAQLGQQDEVGLLGRKIGVKHVFFQNSGGKNVF